MDTKNSISSESLKRVTIRFDFAGSSPSSIVPWVEELKKGMLSFFEDYVEAECGSMKLDMSHPELVTTSSGVGVKELTRGPLHVFQNGFLDGRKDELKLEISHFYIALTINCRAYQDSLPYRKFICELMCSLIEHDKYVKISFFSMRKENLFAFPNGKDLSEAIAPTSITFDLMFGDGYFAGREFKDRYVFPRKGYESAILLDYNRKLRSVRKKDAESSLQAILDLDAKFISNEVFRPAMEDLMRAMDEINSIIYECFEKSLTEKYKSDHAK